MYKQIGHESMNKFHFHNLGVPIWTTDQLNEAQILENSEHYTVRVSIYQLHRSTEMSGMLELEKIFTSHQSVYQSTHKDLMKTLKNRATDSRTKVMEK